MAGILAALFAITYFVPDNGWKYGGHKWKFLTFEKFIHPAKQKKKDIKEIITDVDTSMVDDPLLQHMDGSDGDFGAPTGGDVSENSSTELLMNETGKANLHSFFQVLDGVGCEQTENFYSPLRRFSN